jgi:ankyrin repeat protein
LDNNEYTALNWCARKNQNGLALKLLSMGADVNHQDSNTRYSPLMWAAIKGYLGIVVTCIKADAKLNLQDRVSE